MIMCCIGVAHSLCVCLWLWSVAGAVGTRTGAMSRCILTVYTSYKQYLTVRTRERPPVRVPCAIYENRLTSANLGLDPAGGVGARTTPRVMCLCRILRDVHRGLYATRTVNRIRLRVPWEGNTGAVITVADYDLRIASCPHQLIGDITSEGSER